MSDWKERLGVVYSTANEFEYIKESNNKDQSIENSKQNLRVFLDKKQRRGKKVTIIANYIGTDEGIKAFSKTLKTKCGVGGSVKDNEIIIQGDFRLKILEILKTEGYVKSILIS